ncbi:MAG: hypothetical protein SGPRY_011931, partial [Prymnesium sp.]
ELSILKQLNTTEFASVELPSGSKLLLTPHGEMADGGFLDPSGKQVAYVNHSKLCCDRVEPIPPPQLKAAEEAAHLRDPIDAAMRAHVDKCLPSGSLTTYGSASTSGATEIVCCVSAQAADLNNFWAGRWWGEWKLTASSEASVGQLAGIIKCNVHYFEDGNEDVGGAFVKKVQKFEEEFLSKLEEIYQTLSEQVMQSLRRRLPITRTKFDWDKHTVTKLAMDLQSQAGLR